MKLKNTILHSEDFTLEQFYPNTFGITPTILTIHLIPATVRRTTI